VSCGGGTSQLDFSAAKTNLKGTVQGLIAGNSITLTNGTDTLTLRADSAFTFPSQLSVGSTCSMAIAALPANQSCVATYSQGTVSAEAPPPVKVICGIASSTTEAFVATGALATARSQHTATKLANGKVLVTGGYDAGDNALASAELYDPTTGLWTPTGNLLTARIGHAATLLPNGKVLVSGGSDTTGMPHIGTELYDPSLGTWAATGNLYAGRNNHSTTLVGGKVLLSGGIDNSSGNYIASSEEYDSVTGVWTLKGNLNTARVFHTATALANGKVMLVGGMDFNGNVLTAAELYDPTTGLWTNTFSPVEPKQSGIATLLADGKVLVYGGSSPSGFTTNTEIYNPDSNTAPWTYATADSTTQSHALRTATLLPSGKVLFAGGYDISSGAYTADNALFDSGTGQWSVTAKLINERTDHTATLLDNGKVLVVGGYAKQIDAMGAVTPMITSTAELYVISAAAPSWHAAGSLATARTLHTATLLDSGNVLVVGGDSSYGNAGTGVLSSVEVYNAATGAWSAAASNLINARYGHTATLLPSGKVLVAGGASSASTRLSSAELYDPTTGLWSATGSMLSGHQQHTATLLPNGKVLVVGTGSFGSNGLYNHAELYDPATGAWTPTGAVIKNRDFHSAVLLSNGKVLVMGGNSNGFVLAAEIYDPTTNTWAATANLTVRRDFASATLLPNGKVLLMGSDYGLLQGTAELFDPATNSFVATAPIPVAAGCFAASMTGAIPVLLPNGKVLLSGGFSCARITEYDTTTGVWTARTPFTTAAVSNPTVTLLKNGKVLSVGGEPIDVFPTATAELYW
jgi:Galactose oxidase, central domain/Kelch motif